MRIKHSHFHLTKLVALTCCSLAWSAVQATEPVQLPLDAKDSSVAFLGESFLHNFHGEAKEMSGSAWLDPEAKPPVQRAKLSFPTTKLTTFESARDAKMWSWLEVTAHPDASFQLDSVRPISGDYKVADAEHPASFAVKGSFTLHGKKQPLEGKATGWRDKNHLVIAGETTIDTLKYGLPQIREMVMTVGTNVQVTYKLTFTLPPEYAAK